MNEQPQPGDRVRLTYEMTWREGQSLFDDVVPDDGTVEVLERARPALTPEVRAWCWDTAYALWDDMNGPDTVHQQYQAFDRVLRECVGSFPQPTPEAPASIEFLTDRLARIVSTYNSTGDTELLRSQMFAAAKIVEDVRAGIEPQPTPEPNPKPIGYVRFDTELKMFTTDRPLSRNHFSKDLAYGGPLCAVVPVGSLTEETKP